jgi:hypothetical protein
MQNILKFTEVWNRYAEGIDLSNATKYNIRWPWWKSQQNTRNRWGCPRNHLTSTGVRCPHLYKLLQVHKYKELSDSFPKFFAGRTRTSVRQAKALATTPPRPVRKIRNFSFCLILTCLPFTTIQLALGVLNAIYVIGKSHKSVVLKGFS